MGVGVIGCQSARERLPSPPDTTSAASITTTSIASTRPSPSYGVLARHAGVPSPAAFDNPFLGRIVDIDHPEALAVTPRPLEVIEQGPDEIPSERYAIGNRAVGLQQML